MGSEKLPILIFRTLFVLLTNKEVTCLCPFLIFTFNFYQKLFKIFPLLTANCIYHRSPQLSLEDLWL